MKRKRKKTVHHIKNKCNGGMTTPKNLLTLWEEKHVAWHVLFRNMDLNQIIECLVRVRELQEHKKKGGGP